MKEHLPKLTRPEMARLVEIGDGRFTNCGICPTTTKRLVAKGLASTVGGKIAKTGRVVWRADAVLTDLGRSVLAGLPEQNGSDQDG